MTTRSIEHGVDLPLSPEDAFSLLITPSAICGWWGAARAIVVPRKGGVWCAAWGEEEDSPAFISTARIRTFDPPGKLSLSDFDYYAQAGGLPFKADITTTFAIDPRPGGCTLRVKQSGFPAEAVADDFYEGCVQGWRDTFDNVLRYAGG